MGPTPELLPSQNDFLLDVLFFSDISDCLHLYFWFCNLWYNKVFLTVYIFFFLSFGMEMAWIFKALINVILNLIGIFWLDDVNLFFFFWRYWRFNDFQRVGLSLSAILKYKIYCVQRLLMKDSRYVLWHLYLSDTKSAKNLPRAQRERNKASWRHFFFYIFDAVDADWGVIFITYRCNLFFLFNRL